MRTMRWGATVVAAVVASVVAGAGAALAASVTIGDNFYSPPTVTVAVGQTVTWTNGGQAPHTVTANDGSFDSSPNCPSDVGSCLQHGDSFSHTFASVGTFAYHCKVHGLAMSGTVVVQAVATTPPPGGTTAPPVGELPNTGPGSWTVPFLVGGVALIAFGAVLLSMRRRKAGA